MAIINTRIMNLYLLGYIAEHVRRDETGGQCQKDAERLAPTTFGQVIS